MLQCCATTTTYDWPPNPPRPAPQSRSLLYVFETRRGRTSHEQNLTRTRRGIYKFTLPIHPSPSFAAFRSTYLIRCLRYTRTHARTPDPTQHGAVTSAEPLPIPCDCASRTPQGQADGRTDSVCASAASRRDFSWALSEMCGGCGVRWRLCEGRGRRSS
jgi:hypothetical protein